MSVIQVYKQPNAKVAKIFLFRELTAHAVNAGKDSDWSIWMELENVRNVQLTTKHVQKIMRYVFTTSILPKLTATALGILKKVIFYFKKIMSVNII